MATDASDVDDRSDDVAPAPGRRSRRIRIGVLVVGLVAASGVLGWRAYEHFDRPAVGDRYEVSFTVDRMCGSASMVFDGLTGAGDADVFYDWPTTSGRGTMSLTKVYDLDGGDGIGFDGTLELESGQKVEVQGGTTGKYFFMVGCRIRG